jgi:hypothetical protein
MRLPCTSSSAALGKIQKRFIYYEGRVKIVLPLKEFVQPVQKV